VAKGALKKTAIVVFLKNKSGRAAYATKPYLPHLVQREKYKIDFGRALTAPDRRERDFML
jgi:hypothetical protein